MSAPTMRALWRAALAAAAVALGGCDPHGDEVVITHQQRDAAYAPSIFTASGVIGVELHGAPLAGMRPEETLPLLAAPQRFPTGMRFRALPPGGFDPRNPAHDSRHRLVLVFNAAPPADPQAICRTARPLGGPPAGARGFAVDMAVCRDMEPIVFARMRAVARERADRDFAARALRRLLTQML
ncbi:hypothetical protein [Oceanicella actignis]|uniref:Lipoprotein n=1 Tax=Oceanicella actignis TaxID=1189325 RepID=A0A1M7RWU1_9RHOB|nr:hypothetical protein [Oceanicella actignis]SES99204.1 hypothetical protein SAMN04488119_102264 [Oceanicella actignis]SHN50745.1 hypothetical protein SAMN05216200_101254 [Oceanicella actignis]